MEHHGTEEQWISWLCAKRVKEFAEAPEKVEWAESDELFLRPVSG